MLEKRKLPRRRTLLDGRLEVEKLNGWAVDCAVRNFSASGARVAFQSRVTVPQTFKIAISDRAPEPARIVWYRDGHAGVAFTTGQIDSTGNWDRVCRRVAQNTVAIPPSEATILQKRIDAILARSTSADRRRADR